MSLKKLNELFDVAVSIDSDTERLAFVDEKCDGNVALKSELLSLLNAHVRGNAILEAPTRAFDLVAGHIGNQDSSEKEGATVGNYKLLQKLGEGGMGEVFMAEQLHPIRRKVALKIIREGMNSKQIIARFEAEREALARLDHPNVTRILDAGVTESGRPFFSMELVRGTHLTHYCNMHRVPIEQRLALLEQVCMVIHHAHQKGILHRDIKPSNVMITLHDGVPIPKVIDFGIAKALDRPLTEQTLFTRYGDLVGTPEYMSPEQAEMSGLDLDVRTDIFSLGVLLYELLTGSTPLTQEQIKGKGLLKIFETIRDSEAETPSMRVTRTLAAAETVAEQRQSTAPQLRRSIAGELDWITMKSIAKDRNERYESAAAMAKDIRRFLNGEPVEAAAPSFAYRTRKFYQKHKTVSLVATACAMLLLISTAVSTYWAVTSHRNETLAEQRATELTKKSRALELEKERTEQALVRAINAEKKAEALAKDERRRALLTRSQARFHGEQVQNQIQKFIVAAKAIPASTNVIDGDPVFDTESTEIRVNQFRTEAAVPVSPGRQTEILQLADSLSQVSVMFAGEAQPIWNSANAGKTVIAPAAMAPAPIASASVTVAETVPIAIPADAAPAEPIAAVETLEISSAGLPVSPPIPLGSRQLPARFCEIVLEEERKEFGNFDPFVAIALQAYAEALIAEGTPEKLLAAENHLRESMAILDAAADQPVNQLASLVLFRIVLDRQGKKTQAAEATTKGLAMIVQIQKKGALTPDEQNYFNELKRLLNKSPGDYQSPFVSLQRGGAGQQVNVGQQVNSEYQRTIGRNVIITVPKSDEVDKP